MNSLLKKLFKNATCASFCEDFEINNLEEPLEAIFCFVLDRTLGDQDSFVPVNQLIDLEDSLVDCFYRYKHLPRSTRSIEDIKPSDLVIAGVKPDQPQDYQFIYDKLKQVLEWMFLKLDLPSEVQALSSYFFDDLDSLAAGLIHLKRKQSQRNFEGDILELESALQRFYNLMRDLEKELILIHRAKLANKSLNCSYLYRKIDRVVKHCYRGNQSNPGIEEEENLSEKYQMISKELMKKNLSLTFLNLDALGFSEINEFNEYNVSKKIQESQIQEESINPLTILLSDSFVLFCKGIVGTLRTFDKNKNLQPKHIQAYLDYLESNPSEIYDAFLSFSSCNQSLAEQLYMKNELSFFSNTEDRVQKFHSYLFGQKFRKDTKTENSAYIRSLILQFFCTEWIRFSQIQAFHSLLVKSNPKSKVTSLSYYGDKNKVNKVLFQAFPNIQDTTTIEVEAKELRKYCFDPLNVGRRSFGRYLKEQLSRRAVYTDLYSAQDSFEEGEQHVN